MTNQDDQDEMLDSWLESFETAPIDRFADRLWIGDSRGARDHATLRRLGVTAIVNLTRADFGAEAAGFRVHTVGVPDEEEISPEKIRTFLAVMDEWWASGEHVFIHCLAGISRTSSFLIAWLLHTRGPYRESRLEIEWWRCEDEVRRCRPIVMPHPALRQSVIAFFARPRDD